MARSHVRVYLSDDTNAIVDTPTGEFEEFLDSAEFRRYCEVQPRLHPGEVGPDLLDLVELWLLLGKGLAAFNSFEVYLLTVIEIIDDWLKFPKMFTKRGSPWEITRISNDVLLEHSALNRSTWEIAKSRYEYDQCNLD